MIFWYITKIQIPYRIRISIIKFTFIAERGDHVSVGDLPEGGLQLRQLLLQVLLVDLQALYRRLVAVDGQVLSRQLRHLETVFKNIYV